MAKGIKSKTPLDPKERSKYKLRRQKNNVSAAKHRERQKNAVAERDILKEDNKNLMNELRSALDRNAELENDYAHLVDFLLTHQCVSSPAHREQLYSTFNRARPIRTDLPRPLSVARTEHSDSSDSFYSDSSLAPPPFMAQQDQMMGRPTGFAMDQDPCWKASPASPPQPQNQQPPRYRNFHEFLSTRTGFTPAGPLSEMSNFPFEPFPTYLLGQDYAQNRLPVDQFTPLGQFFMDSSSSPQVLQVLDDSDVNENLAKEFSYQQL